MQNRPIDFNVPEYKRSLIWFQIPHSIKLYESVTCPFLEYFEDTQFSTKAIKTLLCFPTENLQEAQFYSYTSTKTRLHNRSHIKANVKTQLSSLKTELKRFVKIKTVPYFSLNYFLLWKIQLLFIKKVSFLITCDVFIN